MKIWAKTDEFSEGKYLVVRRDGTVPEWPHFVLGAFDPCAGRALRAYAKAAREAGYEPEYIASIEDLASDFDRIAATERAKRIADPTAPPHRKDNPLIVQLMGGQSDLAQVELRRERAGQRPDEQEKADARQSSI